MASLANTYFHQSKSGEQNLLNGFVKESIQILGSTYYYLPREVQIENLILGEDVVSKFGLAVPIEMYLTSSLGFEGDKEMFSKFGLEIRNSYKLEVSKDRWETELKTQFDKNVLNGEASFAINNYIRPREGDLIYDPITKFLMEITFVDHDKEFFAIGKNYKYVLSCEAFAYQNETITTGVAEIDLFELNSKDSLLNQVLMEDGSVIVLEQGGYLLLEDGATPTPIRESGTSFKADAAKIKATIVNPFG
jgi:hypothetical protein